MSTSIQEQTQAMQQMTSSAQNLSGLAEQLRTALRRFKISAQGKETSESEEENA
jgi:methyl-accepting chemotaxis protein